MERVEIELDGRTISLEAGDLARQAGGSVVIRQGDTMVLVAATMAPKPREGIDFFPLTVDYREKTYAAGKIPGGYLKREARPSDYETLTCRLIDRPLRPLFPDGFRNETQLVCFVVSHDQVNPADIIAMTGASAALMISDIPFDNPIAGARIGRVEGNFVFNPTHEESEKSDIQLLMAGTADGIVMVEAGAKEASEEEMMNALEFGHERIKKLIDLQIQLKERINKEKATVIQEEINTALVEQINSIACPKLEQAMGITGKQERTNSVSQIKADLETEINPEGEDDLKGILGNVFHDAEKNVVRKMILEKKKRVDGRNLNEVRPISIKTGYLPRVHGSSVFTRGETQALEARHWVPTLMNND